jgi:hypothetical protein
MAQTNQKFLEKCKDDRQYKAVYSNMSIARFCGFLQTDGHITVLYSSDKTQDVRIILTHSNKDYAWIYGIKCWFEDKLQITSNLPSNDKAIDPNIDQPGLNLVFSRIQARNLINAIDAEEKKLSTFLLFDKKRIAYNLVKESIRIKSSTNKAPLTEELACQLVDIKKHLKEGSGKIEKLTGAALIARLGFPNANFNNAADVIYQNAVTEAMNCGDIVFKNLDPKALNPGLAQFIIGVMDGDGSFAVGLFTHLDKNENTIVGRRCFDLVPLLTVSSNINEFFYLFSIIEKAFGSTLALKTNYVPKGTNLGTKIQIKNRENLKKFAVPFFDKYQPTLAKNEERLKIFKEVLNALPEAYGKKQKIIELVNNIYDTDLYDRSKTREEFLAIVDKHYNWKNLKKTKN